MTMTQQQSQNLSLSPSSSVCLFVVSPAVQTHVLVVGWERATILQSEDGGTTSEFALTCHPVQQPVVADFTGDGVNDIIITCDTRCVCVSMKEG